MVRHFHMIFVIFTAETLLIFAVIDYTESRLGGRCHV